MNVQQLESRSNPSGGVWYYDAAGHVLGKALFADHAHPAWVYQPDTARETVGGNDRVYLEGVTREVVDQTAGYYAPVLDVIGFTNDPTLPYDKIIHFSSTRPGPNAGIAQLGGHEGWVTYPGDLGIAAEVAAHEAGHTFGLVHNAVPGSLMYPVLQLGSVAFLPDELTQLREAVRT